MLAGLHSLELGPQTYVGAAAQHTAVHVQRAAALVQLADSVDLRRAMGAAGGSV